MLKRKFSKLGELGSMMVEALAMLGLISMVTPIVYKKAAERNTELQDVNAASQMRNLIRAVDEYIQENFGKITGGEIVTNDCLQENSVNFNNFVSDSTGEHINVDIRHLCEFLPYGFLDSSGNVAESKIFNDNFEVVIKKIETNQHNKKTLTGFIVANPKQGSDFPRIRASRISSMIGGNGGYVIDNEALGVQGMWGVEDIDSELGLSGIDNGAIIASSVHPISSGSGDNNEDVLYRINQPQNKDLNTMEVALWMGKDASTAQNIEYINQAVIYGSREDRAFGGAMSQDAFKEQALLLKDGAGAMIDGVLSVAEERFKVTSDGGINAAGNGAGVYNFEVDANGAVKAAGGKFAVDSDGSFAAADGNFGVDKDGNMATKGNATIDKDLLVNGNTVLGGGSATSGYVLTVNGNAIINGALRVVGKFKANEIDTGKLRAGTSNPDNDNDSDYTLVTDSTQLKVGVDKFSVQRSTGNTKIQGGDLLVTSSSGTENFLADGTSGYTYARGLRAGGVSSDTEWPLEVLQNGNINLNLKSSTNIILGEDSSNNEILRFDNTSSGIRKGTTSAYGRVKTTSTDVNMATVGTDGAGQIGVYSNEIRMRVLGGIDGTGYTQDFSLKRESASESSVAINNNKSMKVFDKDNKQVLYVDTAETDRSSTVTDRTLSTSKGGVYIRRGVVDLEVNNETNYATPSFKSTDKDKGYVRADMLVSQKVSNVLNSAGTQTGNALSGNVRSGNTGTQYDAYMVNPAYTSVMHDIKLTTRGGARLSDLLPDFINKGIYVVDNTYSEGSTLWPSSVSATTGGGINISGLSECTASQIKDTLCPTSPFVGVVPTPQCPPGYQKVIQVIPYGFNIAQAGMPTRSGQTASTRNRELYIDTDMDRQTPDPDNNAQAFYYQKNTWLRTRVRMEGSDDSFVGWSVLLGFVYPESRYTNHFSRPADSNYYIWNLFPVYYRELEAYANVYCYFKRGNFDSNITDTTYDQLNNFRKPFDKGDTGFTKRLNDPNMNYTNPW